MSGLLAVVYLFLLRYLPAQGTVGDRGYVPGRQDLERVFGPAVAGLLVLLLVIGVLGGWLLAGRMLSPLRRIQATTRAVAAGSLVDRVRMGGPRDEFRELADCVDGMLDRLRADVVGYQRFAANASHELRTPLANTQALIDAARRDPHRDVDDLLRRLDSSNRRAIDLTLALLMLSRVDGGGFTREEVDLSLAVEESVDVLLPLAEKCAVEIESDTQVGMVEGSSPLLEQLSTNLLHNAIVHNLPERGTVWIRTGVRDGRVHLEVENTGPDLEEATLDTLTEPFQRGIARVHREQVGAGLGLAIATSIVRAHHAVMDLSLREGGGLRVSVRFPVSPSAGSTVVD